MHRKLNGFATIGRRHRLFKVAATSWIGRINILQKSIDIHGKRWFWYDTDATREAARLEQRINWRAPGDRLGTIPHEMLYAMPPPTPPPTDDPIEVEIRRQLYNRIPIVLVALAAIIWMVGRSVNRRRLGEEESTQSAETLRSIRAAVPWAVPLLKQAGILPHYPG